MPSNVLPLQLRQATSIMDHQISRQKVHQITSVIKTNTCVFIVLKIKCELKCQNELFLLYNFSGNSVLFLLLRLFEKILT